MTAFLIFMNISERNHHDFVLDNIKKCSCIRNAKISDYFLSFVRWALINQFPFSKMFEMVFMETA